MTHPEPRHGVAEQKVRAETSKTAWRSKNTHRNPRDGVAEQKVATETPATAWRGKKHVLL